MLTTPTTPVAQQTWELLRELLMRGAGRLYLNSTYVTLQKQTRPLYTTRGTISLSRMYRQKAADSLSSTSPLTWERDWGTQSLSFKWDGWKFVLTDVEFTSIYA